MKQLKQPQSEEKTFTPNVAGSTAFFFFLICTWLLIRVTLVESLGDGILARVIGIAVGIVVMNPLYKLFVNFLFYIYDED